MHVHTGMLLWIADVCILHACLSHRTANHDLSKSVSGDMLLSVLPHHSRDRTSPTEQHCAQPAWHH